MQFIFGNNKSQYDLLYADEKHSDANAVLGLIRLPFAPSEDFDIYGYMPFGANSNRPLYFRCKKDTAFNRNVYFLHGVYRELLTEYFFGTDYVGDMVTNFIPQSEFDSIRETPEKCTFRPTPNAKLVQAAEADAGKIDKDLLIAILMNLYQRNKVVLVMDDEKFNTDYLRVVICYIFKFLTPSLRKICSYIIGMYDTESMDFMIRAIPRSMYRKDRTFCVDLSAKTCDPETNAAYQKVAAKLYGAPVATRKELFELFEILYYGRSSTYKKQLFAEYIDLVLQNTVPSYETLLKYYLGDERFQEDMKIPECIAKAIAPYYRDENYLDSAINMADFDPLNPTDFYETGIVAIRKLYLLADPQLTYIHKKITEIYSGKIHHGNAPDLIKTYKKFEQERTKGEVLPSKIETIYMMILDNCMDELKPRLQFYSNLANNDAISKHFAVFLKKYYGKLIPEASIATLCMQEYRAYISHHENKLRDYNLDIQKTFNLKANDIIQQHNSTTQKKIDDDRRKSEEDAQQWQEKAIRTDLSKIRIPMNNKDANNAPAARNLAYYPILLGVVAVSSDCQNEEIIQDLRFRVVQHILYSYATDPEFFSHQDDILRLITSPDEIHHIAISLMKGENNEEAWLWFPYLIYYHPSNIKFIQDAKMLFEEFVKARPANVSMPSNLLKISSNILTTRAKNVQGQLSKETYVRCENIYKFISQQDSHFAKPARLLLDYAAQLLPKPAAPERSGLLGRKKP